MASGKTSVGQALARLLGWAFVDFDDEIEAEAGASIPEIFEHQGEPAFRRLEKQVGRQLLEKEKVVLATGGGWAAAEGRLTDLPDATLSVWLRIAPETAVRRAGGQELERPLLAVDDPVGRARELLERREPRYREADVILDAEDATPEELARTIARLVGSTPDGTSPNNVKTNDHKPHPD